MPLHQGRVPLERVAASMHWCMQCMRSILPMEVEHMSMITVRGLDAETKRLLQERAVRHGRSMESEARAILAEAVRSPREPIDLVATFRELFHDAPDVELPFPPRTEMQRPIDL